MMKKTFVTFATPDIEDYAGITRKINEDYCKKHKYEFISKSERKLDDSYDPHWEKVRLIRDTLGNARRSWVFFLDADAAVNQDDIKLETFIKRAPRKADVLICHDGMNKPELSKAEREKKHFVNTGAIIVKNTKWARNFMDHWLNTAGKYKKGAELQDQDRFVEMLQNDEKGAFSDGKVHVFPVNAFNSVFDRPYAETFIVHMMKRSTDERKKRFTEILNKKEAKSPAEVVMRAFHTRPRIPEAKIAIVTMYDDPIGSYSRFATAITNMYATRNGYETVVVRDRLSERDPQWDKVFAVGEVLKQKKHDFVMWIDSDATFQKHEITLESFIEKYMKDGVDMIICDDKPNKSQATIEMAEDTFFPNTGTFLFRNSDWSRKFCETWWKNPMNKERARYHEQDVLMNLYRENRDGLKSKVKLIECEEMNSAFSKLPAKDTLKGGNRESFVIHMMARNAKDRRGVFEKMLADMRKESEEHTYYVPDRLYKEMQQASNTEDKTDNGFFLIGLLLVIVAGIMVVMFFYFYQKQRQPPKITKSTSKPGGPRDLPPKYLKSRDTAPNPASRDSPKK